jgi:hypothetical protein
MVNRITRNTLVSIFALALGAGTAVADEAPTKMAKADETKTAAAADPAASTNPAADPGVAKTVTEAPATSWPLEIINRSLTLPKGAWSAGLGLSANNDFSAIGAEATGLWGLSYGVSDKLSIGVAYGLNVEPSSSGKGPLGFNVGYTYYAEGNLSLTGTASAGYDLDGEAMAPVSLGTYAWYNVTPVITLITPGGQLNVGVEDPNEIGFTMPVSVGYQATPHIFTSFDTNILPNLGISEGETMMFGADTIPVGVSGFYSPSNKMDFGISISTDAKNSPGDSLGFGFLFIYYGGV